MAEATCAVLCITLLDINFYTVLPDWEAVQSLKAVELQCGWGSSSEETRSRGLLA